MSKSKEPFYDFIIAVNKAKEEQTPAYIELHIEQSLPAESAPVEKEEAVTSFEVDLSVISFEIKI